MFGPEVGPAILTHGHSFAERLGRDEELVAEICKRFETARSEGRFPTLRVANRDLKRSCGVLPVRMGPDGTASTRIVRPTTLGSLALGGRHGSLQRGPLRGHGLHGMLDMRDFAASGSRSCSASVTTAWRSRSGLPLAAVRGLLAAQRADPRRGVPARVGDVGQIVSQARWPALTGARGRSPSPTSLCGTAAILAAPDSA